MNVLHKATLAAILASAITWPSVAAPNKDADSEWTEISSAGLASTRTQVVARVAPANGASLKAPRSDAQWFLERANQFGAFHQKHPGHRQAREAKRQEAIALLHAGLRGDQGHRKRCSRLVDEIRGNRSYSAAERLEIVGYAGNLGVIERRIGNPAELNRAFAQVAQDLAKECPESPEGYESLLAVAQNSPDEQAQEIYAQLLAKGTPPEIRAVASQWMDRHALIGEKLASVIQPALRGGGALQNANGITVVYAWSVDDFESTELAKIVGSIQMPGLRVFGVNLDSADKAPAARQMAALLPGEQLTMAEGADNAIARTLLLREPALIYVTDRSGTIATVSARSNPSRAIIEASQR